MPSPKADSERSYQHVPEDRLNERWLSRTNARDALGITSIAFQRLVATGELTQYRINGNTRVFDPVEIAELAETNLEEPTSGNSAPSENITAATKLVTQAQAHVEKLVNLMVSGQEKSQAMYERTISTLTDRITSLEKTHNEALRLKEDNAWSQLEREVAIERLTGEETRRREIWQNVLPHVAPIVQGLSLGVANAMPWVKAAGGFAVQQSTAADPVVESPKAEVLPPKSSDEPASPPASNVSFAERAAQLLASIGRDRLTMLAEAGVLPDEDTITLRQLIGSLPEATPQPTESEVQS